MNMMTAMGGKLQVSTGSCGDSITALAGIGATSISSAIIPHAESESSRSWSNAEQMAPAQTRHHSVP